MAQGLPEQIASYLPTRVIGQLAALGTPPQAPFDDRFEAAALFTDLTGFTPLAERLARQGPRGAEQLTALLDPIFGLLIDRVVAAGGDIVTFAGDALLALWPTEPDRDAAACARAAVGCAVACRAVIDELPLQQGAKLQLRSGVGAGACSLHHVGGLDDRWSWVAAGEALITTGRAEKAAAPGQILVSDAVATLLGPSASLAPAADGCQLLEDSPVVRSAPLASGTADGSAVRAYLPLAVLARIDAGQTRWLAELRSVVAVFLHVHDLDPSQPADGRVLQQLVHHAQALLRDSGGTLNKLMADDNGTTLVIGFGFPPHAHEDDTVRAVRTASRLAEHCEGAGLAFGAGVTTGRAFCGAYGSDHRREYTMIGASVNLAARLMMIARDAVLCGPHTMRDSMGRLTYVELPPVQVRGVAQPVRVGRPAGERDLTGRHEVLLGRGAEESGPAVVAASLTGLKVVGRWTQQRVMAGRLDQLVATGRKGVVVVRAEAGFGKSLMGAWLHAQALNAGTTPLLGECEPSSRTNALHPWRQVLQALLQVQGPDDLDGLQARLDAVLADQPRLAKWTPLLIDVLPFAPYANETTAQMQGARRADALGEIITAILAADAAEQPRMLLLEDVHWMDHSSWALLRSVVRAVPRLLVVLLTRPMGAQAPAEYTEILERPDCDLVVLDRLGDGEIQELVCRRLGVPQLPDSVAQAVTLRAEGNPFYASELTYALLASGRVAVQDGALVVHDDHVALDLPDTLQGVITSRLDGLDPHHGLTAKVASVIGRTFGRGLLQDVHPEHQDAQALDSHLRALSQAGIAERDAQDPDAPWSFRHAIIQEAAYSLLPHTQRRELHAEVARWFEARTDEGAQADPRRAWHWRRAEELDRAVDALETAGEAAVEHGADREGLALLDEALELNDALGESGRSAPPARLALWHEWRGEALMQMGDMFSAKAAFEVALAQLGQRLPTSGVGWSWWLVRKVLEQLRYRVLPFGAVQRLEEGERARLAQLARVLAHWSSVAYFTIEPLHWFIGGVAAINIADRLDDDQVSGQALGSFGNVVGALKLQRAARYYFRRNQGITDVRNHVVGLWGEAVFELTYCRFDAALEVVGRGLDHSDRTADRYSQGLGHTIRGVVHHLSGRLGPAADDFADAVAVGRQTQNTEHMGWGLAFGVPALLALDRLRQLSANLEDCQALIGELDPFTHVSFHGVRAQVRARAGQLDEALADVAELLRIHGEHPLALFTHLPGFGGACEAVQLAREAAQTGTEVAAPEGWTLALLDKKTAGLMTAGAFSYLYFRPRKALLAGTRAWRMGKPAAAEKAWAAAAASAEHLGLPYERALVYLEQARLLTPGSAAHQEAVTQARTALAALDAIGDLRRLDAFAAR